MRFQIIKGVGAGKRQSALDWEFVLHAFADIERFLKTMNRFQLTASFGAGQGLHIEIEAPAIEGSANRRVPPMDGAAGFTQINAVAIVFMFKGVGRLAVDRIDDLGRIVKLKHIALCRVDDDSFMLAAMLAGAAGHAKVFLGFHRFILRGRPRTVQFCQLPKPTVRR